jgi:CheY-like chemotaxis protein
MSLAVSLPPSYMWCVPRLSGHTCDEAEDGYGAIEMVREKLALSPGGRTYDAILMDFVMPNMDGPTATKEIRAMGYTAPIFGVTGNGFTTDIDYFMSCGVDGVLLKPLNMADFYRSLKQPHY